MNREEMVEELKESLMQITFTKLDGTTRVMKCTLHKSLTQFINEATKAKLPTNEEVLPVWDIENQAWRSFRVASVTDVKNIGKIPDNVSKPNLPKPPGEFIEE
tara:strand:+ start:74 stop:382 length:309 start_codon:yes stop_codon:yes gene_type:complete